MTPQVATSSALRMVVGLHGVSLVANNESGLMALKSWQLSGTEQGFQSIESALRQVFGSERLLELDFNSKICALSSAASTLVPRRLFDPHNLEQYFKLLLQAGAERTYAYEKLEAFDCYLVWAAETGLTRLCGQYFSSKNIHHLAAPLLRAFHAMAPMDGYAVYANLRGQQVQVTVFERRNLVFFNTFDFAKPADLLYFILLAYKQFDLDPLVIPLTLSGTLLEDSDIFRLLLRYIRPMRFPPLSTGFQVPEGAKNIPAHYWFDLASV